MTVMVWLGIVAAIILAGLVGLGGVVALVMIEDLTRVEAPPAEGAEQPQ